MANKKEKDMKVLKKKKIPLCVNKYGIIAMGGAMYSLGGLNEPPELAIFF